VDSLFDWSVNARADRPESWSQDRARGRQERVPNLAAQTILDRLPGKAWRRITWREGRKGALAKQFARIEVYRGGYRGQHLPSQGGLTGKRPLPGQGGDHKPYVVWGLAERTLQGQAGLLHVRWIVERLHQDPKGELGLDDHEGRCRPGWHRHRAWALLGIVF
jgi:SRSO17 transposase